MNDHSDLWEAAEALHFGLDYLSGRNRENFSWTKRMSRLDRLILVSRLKMQ